MDDDLENCDNASLCSINSGDLEGDINLSDNESDAKEFRE
jgi:hypothetical protein